MESVLITGALGLVGRWAVDRFAEEYDVIAVDRTRPDDPRADVEYRAADLTEQGPAWELVLTEEPDAVVHLAAIPAIGMRAGAETFTTNVTAGYNVLTAAGEAGIPIAWASSECAYGENFADPPRPPEYLPIDTDHRTDPEDPYGTSKVALEAVAASVARKYDTKVTTIRPSWVQEPGAYHTKEGRAEFDPDDPGRHGNYWSYVDVRDVVELFVSALEVGHDGHEIYNAVADENFIDYPTVDAIESGYGTVPQPCNIEGDECAYSNAKAEAELGWSPQHSWRTAEDEDVPRPEL
ncbi:NAD-dependent epimerase/dehydratase [Salinarchaeum sp. Harcht-Bsk1]|uniref:NAD-dependent epimerase/dehydratase family protein n=1 Tax=Salinarchaeum sp. Harcht-Bsk1 TaxID=1333523 RepID=UPI0003422846|nr:NAD(P)-dependent oxidoreductase [Salinarchaeum sp. Harcht-Bsk1]AGN00134.1 NAD-dependent epimerase/dehydratase [Salinarchaeum sp. Harcht-Bsk1]